MNDVYTKTKNEPLKTRYEIQFKNTPFQQCLVATDSFHQGETILILPTMTQSDPDKFSIEISPGLHINCSNDHSKAINHSCSPNAAVRNGKIVAWTCISKGDPITIDYNRTETRLAEPFNCFCGRKNCRGRIE